MFHLLHLGVENVSELLVRVARLDRLPVAVDDVRHALRRTGMERKTGAVCIVCIDARKPFQERWLDDALEKLWVCAYRYYWCASSLQGVGTPFLLLFQAFAAFQTIRK